MSRFDTHVAQLKRRLDRLGVPSHCYGITKDGSRHVLRTTIGGVVKEHQLGIGSPSELSALADRIHREWKAKAEQ